MKRFLCLVALFSCVITCSLIARPSATRADGILDFFHPHNHKYKKQEPYKPHFGHRNTPPMTLVQLANVIDILEHDLREDGTLVIQQPSVWGQARMTTYRKAFDDEMKNEVGHFKFVLSARIARSDQASFESQTALAASLSGGAQGKGATPPAPISLSDLAKSVADLLKSGKDIDPIQYAKAFELLTNVFKAIGMDNGQLGVEPTIFLDEKKRYLDHLNELRRINMGDDTADSAGYGLYLVRMPVSIEPGQKTDQGHGAMLTVTAEHNFGPFFLQRTFRNLVINDLVDQLTPILFEIRDHGLDDGADPILKELDKIHLDQALSTLEKKDQEETAHARAVRQNASKAAVAARASLNKRPSFALDLAYNWKNIKIPSVPSNIINGKSYPIAPSDLLAVFAEPLDIFVPKEADPVPSTAMECALRFLKLLRDAQHTVRPRATDVRLFLQHELEAAYDIMEKGIEGGTFIPLTNTELMGRIAKDFHNRSFDEKAMKVGSSSLEADFARLMKETSPRIAHEAMGFLCWAIAVDAALLNERLQADIERVNGHAGFHCTHPVQGLVFYLPPAAAAGEPSLAAAQVFQDYVKARWPLIAFALDPVVDQQNVADALSIRRDLKLAVAFAFSTGQISFSQMMQFHRQISIDAETIALNRTVTCFSHGNDTFGWRFTPRYQNPPSENNARALTSLLVRSGPNPKYQVNKSKLERGQRELTAVIVMPSFLNTIRVDVRGNYFKLTHPQDLTISSGRMLEQGRFVKELMETSSTSVCDADKYRRADIKGLHVKLQQVEKMLPMQNYKVNVPYENTLGGFDLFVPGTTTLVPILAGYDGVDQATSSLPTDANGSKTTLFLYGKHFSILETKVVAGGRFIPDADVEILSREVMRVQIAKDVQATEIKDARGGNRPFVEVQVATPNGISNRVLIPLKPIAPPPAAASASEYALTTTALTFQYYWAKGKDGKNAIQMRDLDPALVLKINRSGTATGLAPAEMDVVFALATTDGKVKLDPAAHGPLKQRANGGDSSVFKIKNADVAKMGQEILKTLADGNVLRPDQPGPAELQATSIQATPGIPPVPQGIRKAAVDVAQNLKVTIEYVP